MSEHPRGLLSPDHPLVVRSEQLPTDMLTTTTRSGGTAEKRGAVHQRPGIPEDAWQKLRALPGLREVARLVETAASSECRVLIQGETGTGKELVARAIHDRGRRAQEDFVSFNCGALVPNLAQRELFGHVKGAFTDAMESRIGLIASANGGTLFLDEIGDLAPELQLALLRVLQEGRIRRVGSNRDEPVNVRVVSASHRDLKELIKQGRFREDFYGRIDVFPIEIPPLRERREDISILAQWFLKRDAEREGKLITGFSAAAEAALHKYDWPRNVRELEHAIESSVVLCKGSRIEVSDLRPEIGSLWAAAKAEPAVAISSPFANSYLLIDRPRLWRKASELLYRKRRVILVETDGGAGELLARQIAPYIHGTTAISLELRTTNECSDTEFFSILTKRNGIGSFGELRQALQEQAAGKPPLIVLQGARARSDRLETLAAMLGSLLSDDGLGAYLIVVAGARGLAQLQPDFYHWSKLLETGPYLDVPDLTLDEIQQALQLSGGGKEPLAQLIYGATGGHYGLVQDLVQEASADGLGSEQEVHELVRTFLATGRKHLYYHHNDTDAITAIRQLLRGGTVEPLGNVDIRYDPVKYAISRLYFDRFLTYDPSGCTQLRCPAVRMLFERIL